MSRRYSYKDIENATKQILRSIEQNRDRRAQEATDRLLYGTASDPRGLWKLFHILNFPSIWIFYTFTVVIGAEILLGKIISFNSPFPALAGFVVGFMIARFWFKSDYAKLYPFKSVLLYGWVYPICIIALLLSIAKAIGITSLHSL